MKKIFLITIFLIIASITNAQTKQKAKPLNICEPTTYVHAALGGGLHNLNYDIGSFGSKGLGMGFMFNGGITHFFTDNFGATTGLILNFTNTSSTLDGIESIENAIDEESNTYTHRTYFYGLKEKQSTLQFGIPIGGYYQHEIGKKLKITGGAGVLLSVALFNNFKTQSGYLETRGYYPEANLELKGMTQHHEYTAKDFKGSFQLKPSIAPFVQAGVVYCINKEWSAMAGAYFSYGVNSIVKSSSTNIYNPDCKAADAYQNPNYNSICASEVIDKINPISVGIMVGAAYNIGNIFNRKKQPKQLPINIEIIDLPDSLLVTNVDETELEIIETEPFEDKINNIDNEKQPTDSQVVIVDVKKELSLNGFNMQFAFNDSTALLNSRYQNYLDQIAEDMKENPEKKLIITGHTCDIGTYEANYKVALRRAGFAKQQLIMRGIKADRITTKSKAYLEPLVPNTSEENRRLNRRIEFKYSE